MSDATLPTASRAATALYDESLDDNSIWVLGGIGCGTCFYRYFINNDSIIDYATLSNAAWTYSANSAVIIDGLLYYLTGAGSVFKYDILNRFEYSSEITSISSVYHGCLTKHPNNTKLYIHGPSESSSSSNQFFVYDFASDVYSSGPSLNYARFRTTCVVNEYETNPYLYAFGGNSPYIERINLNTLDKWSVSAQKFYYDIDGASFEFDDYSSHWAIVSYFNFIFLLNGFDGYNGGSEEMFVFDVSTQTMILFGNFPVYVHGSRIVIAQDRMYLFGGVNSAGWKDFIYYTDATSLVASTSATDTIDSTTNTTTASTSTSTSTSISTSIGTSTSTSISTSITTSMTTQTTTGAITTAASTKLKTSDPTVYPTMYPTIYPTQEAQTTAQFVTATATATATRNEDREELIDDSSNEWDISESFIIVGFISVLLSCCCLVCICVFAFLVRMFLKQRSKEREIELRQQLSVRSIKSIESVPDLDRNLYSTNNALVRNTDEVGTINVVHNSKFINGNNNNGQIGAGPMRVAKQKHIVSANVTSLVEQDDDNDSSGDNNHDEADLQDKAVNSVANDKSEGLIININNDDVHVNRETKNPVAPPGENLANGFKD